MIKRYARNAQHGRTHYHRGGRGRSNYRPGLNLKISPCVTKPPLRYSRLQPSINTRPSRINSVLIDATFCSIRYSWIHRSFKYAPRAVYAFSLSLYLCICYFSFSLSLGIIIRYHVLTGNDRVCDSNDTRLLILTSREGGGRYENCLIFRSEIFVSVYIQFTESWAKFRFVQMHVNFSTFNHPMICLSCVDFMEFHS